MVKSDNITYWLYYNNEFLTGIRAPKDSTANDVRNLAIEQFRKVPLCFPDAPATYMRKLKFATVI